MSNEQAIQSIQNSFVEAGFEGKLDYKNLAIPLDQQGIDSLTMMAFVFELEESTSFRLPNHMLQKGITLKQIIQFLCSESK